MIVQPVTTVQAFLDDVAHGKWAQACAIFADAIKPPDCEQAIHTGTPPNGKVLGATGPIVRIRLANGHGEVAIVVDHGRIIAAMPYKLQNAAYWGTQAESET